MTILILGAGESGLGSALLAKKNNYNVFISDAGDILDSTKEKLIYSSINFEENSHEKAKTLNVDLVIKSPGISDSSDIVKFLDSKQLKIISEIEFASNYCNSKIIGITGSNGKTTTTTLIHKLISELALMKISGHGTLKFFKNNFIHFRSCLCKSSCYN